GAFWATTEDQYPRYPYREVYPHKENLGENNGILMLDLKRLREIGDWNNIWTNETLSLYEKIGPLIASDPDVFTSLAYWFPTWHYRLRASTISRWANMLWRRNAWANGATSP
ncbi:hypothetical protein PMAYCL1PPCAC_16407, partial [Pristionchus mayeri]